MGRPLSWQEIVIETCSDAVFTLSNVSLTAIIFVVWFLRLLNTVYYNLDRLASLTTK
jgi:hypothetical protein